MVIVLDFSAEIAKWKREKDALILAHTYQPSCILDLADVTGDSFALAKAATTAKNRLIVLCGVRFMAESVKILSPEKEVLLPAPEASCAMARQIPPEFVRKFRKEHPDMAVVCYINTTAAMKAECDVCVTSSSALKIVRAMDAKKILFVPDRNLGSYIQKMAPEKEIILAGGYCPIHDAVTAADVAAAKNAHPGAKVAMHPECPAQALELADRIGSTADIINYIKSSDDEIIVGTERGVVDDIKAITPSKQVIQLCPEKMICPDMKRITPEILCRALRGECGEKIEIPEEIRLKAKKCIDEMLRLG